MNQEQLLQLHQETCEQARALMARKNNDYADPGERVEDPFAVFANFRQCEYLNICTTEAGFLVRLSDKFSRLCNLLHEGHVQAVKDESIEDTLEDIINYSILIKAYLRVKKEAKQ